MRIGKGVYFFGSGALTNSLLLVYNRHKEITLCVNSLWQFLYSLQIVR